MHYISSFLKKQIGLGAFFGLFVFISIVYADSLQQDVRAQGRADPEPSTIMLGHVKSAMGLDYMAVTANPLATEAAQNILAKGGSAVDAAIAAQLVLGLVEPQSSGLGGGAFALVYTPGDTPGIKSYDGRETAPTAAGEDLFLDEKGRPLDFAEAVGSGISIGVPGTPKLLKHMHDRHGRLPWEALFAGAIDLAGNGFAISPRLHALVMNKQAELIPNSRTGSYFFTEGGVPHPVGTILKNPDYADTLKVFRDKGSAPFYEGELAARVVDAVRNARKRPGEMRPADLENYQVRQRAPVCFPYRTYTICGMGEPSSGGLSIGQIMGMVEHFDLPDWGAEDARSWHVLAEASRLAFADRNMYMADSDFVNTPGSRLLDPAYLAKRADMIDPDRVRDDYAPGIPPGWEQEGAASTGQERPGTSHISIVDRYGGAISMTTTIEQAFGSRIMANGYLLNNELTDFSFRPEADGRKIANRVQGGKRPRSSMSPTIVLNRAGRPVMLIGSAGGSRIIGYVVQRLVAVLDWNQSLNEALSAPHILARGPALEVEYPSPRDAGIGTLMNHLTYLIAPYSRARPPETLLNALDKRGHKLDPDYLNSGMTAIIYKNGYYTGAADPRREGTAAGE